MNSSASNEEVNAEQLGNIVDKLVPLHLSQVVEKLWRADPDFANVVRGLAFHVLQFFMGDAWTRSRVIGEASKGFIQQKDSLDIERQMRQMARLCRLAECLYALQRIPGIRHRVAIMKVDDIESTLAELECASLFALPEYKFQFIIPHSEKGKDYEAEFVMDDESTIYCEIKSKKESTKIGPSTIRNTLEKARRQLPSNKPGIIFLRIPEHWVTKEGYEILTKSIENVMRQSKRIICIIVLYELWKAQVNAHIVWYKFVFFFNFKSPLYSDLLKRTIERSQAHPEHILFRDFVIRDLTWTEAWTSTNTSPFYDDDFDAITGGEYPDRPQPEPVRPNQYR